MSRALMWPQVSRRYLLKAGDDYINKAVKIAQIIVTSRYVPYFN